MTQKIYILLPVHNRKEITRMFVASLHSQTYQNHHLVLIDDGSTDSTADMVLDAIPDATVIRGNGNWWWAGCLQQGLDRLRRFEPDPTDVVLFINDDVTLEPVFLEMGVKILQEHQHSLLLAKIRDPDTGDICETGIHADASRLRFEVASRPDEINCLSTKGLFATFSVVEKVGNFHPRLLPHYLSDYEWTLRASRKGIQCITDTRLVLNALNRGPSGYWDIANVTRVSEYLKLVFSNKSHANPFYLSAFVLLTSGWPAAAYTIAKVWARFLRETFRRTFAD